LKIRISCFPCLGSSAKQLAALDGVFGRRDQRDADLTEDALSGKEGLSVRWPQVVLGLHAPHDFFGRQLGLALGQLEVGELPPMPPSVQVEGNCVTNLPVMLQRRKRGC
jgi:hypothetical protein